MGVLQTALLLGSSSPLAKTGRDPSLLPFGRTPRPGSRAVQCPGAPPARPAPCPHRPNCHPPARAGVTGITCLLLLSPKDSRTSGSFLPSPQPPLPAPKTRSPVFQPDPSPSARPQPCSPYFSPASVRGSCRAWRPELPSPAPETRGPQD